MFFGYGFGGSNSLTLRYLLTELIRAEALNAMLFCDYFGGFLRLQVLKVRTCLTFSAVLFFLVPIFAS
jgi:hypothetical protein